MRAFAIGGAVLALAACGSEVEPETVETVGNGVMSNAMVDAEPVPEIGSTYTKLDDCELLEENAEEGGYFKSRCKGHAGYDVIVTTSDLRDTMALVTPEGEERELAFSQVIAEGRFSNLGKTIEWRGATPEEPRVLIVRMNVANPEDPMAADTSYLAVAQLADPTCIVARIPPGPGQNVVARQLADRDELPECMGVDPEELPTLDEDA